MYFEITQSSKGLRIISQNKEYYFSSKLFSHSSELTDQHGNLIGSLKRSSWWRMKFDLHIEDKSYELCQSALTIELRCQDTGLQFFDLGGGEFFRKNARISVVSDYLFYPGKETQQTISR